MYLDEQDTASPNFYFDEQDAALLRVLIRSGYRATDTTSSDPDPTPNLHFDEQDTALIRARYEAQFTPDPPAITPPPAPVPPFSRFRSLAPAPAQAPASVPTSVYVLPPPPIDRHLTIAPPPPDRVPFGRTTRPNAKNPHHALTNTTAPFSESLTTFALTPPSGPQTQSSISLDPDNTLFIAPEDLHAPIPDLPQYDFLMTDLMEAPSLPGTDLDVSAPTTERENRKRSRDDDGEQDKPSSLPQRKKSEWTSSSTISDSSSGGDIPMDDETYRPYRTVNKSGRGSTPPEKIEQL